jgi:alpha-glucosidase
VAETWQAFRASIPWVIARQQFNLLGSHDTSRILSTVGGNPALNRLAVAFLFTYPGVPSVYYGDEIGLAGVGGIGARGCMPWDRQQWDHELRHFYQQMIQLRRSSSALVDGGFQMLLAEADTLAYLRDSEQEQIIVVAQRGPASRPAGPLRVDIGGVQDGMEFTELFSRARRRIVQGQMVLPELPPGAQVWISC